ncbi:FHA domain-containing protein [Pseudomonas putida]|uniref:FHA domain-containing protein n=1 Tax=Pseudomonas putida TaxID=303 RepID=UPI0018E6CA56|nr:FHA domain-containing protein [Pseudomonas putida]MBI6926743.1 FHA domain-containing protein [Pseudomonas putida]
MSLLTLSILNLEHLQHNVTARHQFDRAGGTIGSADATWLINDRAASIAPLHCEVRWIEGGFCVIDRCDRTYLNANLESVGPLTPRRLLEGDQLRIGAYRLLVQFSLVDMRSLEDLVSPAHSTLDQWLIDAPDLHGHYAPITCEAATEICSAFEPDLGNDPLAALDAEQVKGTEWVDPVHALHQGARS